MQAYVYKAALLCEDCGRERAADIMSQSEAHRCQHGVPYCWGLCGEGDCLPQGPYADGGGEADAPAHCDHCGIFLENPLTSDGLEYVREQIAEAYKSKTPLASSVAASVWEPWYQQSL